ncbi:MAG TPA: SHOCT domain-containing protein [Coriobacteriia bacterium]
MMYGRGFDYGYGNMMGGGSWLGWLLMLLFGALVVAGLVLLVIWMVRSSSGHHGTGSATGSAPAQPGAAAHDEAVAITRRRFASGEITKEQYDEIMRALGG